VWELRVTPRTLVASFVENALAPIRATPPLPPGVPATFSDPPVAFRVLVPLPLYHYWSDGGNAISEFWTRDGNLSADEASDDLALSERNQAIHATPAWARVGSRVWVGEVAPTSRRPGGGRQVWVEDPKRDLWIF